MILGSGGAPVPSDPPPKNYGNHNVFNDAGVGEGTRPLRPPPTNYGNHYIFNDSGVGGGTRPLRAKPCTWEQARASKINDFLCPGNPKHGFWGSRGQHESMILLALANKIIDVVARPNL